MSNIIRKADFTYLITKFSIIKRKKEYEKVEHLFDDAIQYLTNLLNNTEEPGPNGWELSDDNKLIVDFSDGQLEFVGYHKVIETKTTVLDII